MIQARNTAKKPGNKAIMESDLGEMVFAAEKISKKRLRKGKGKPIIFCFEIDIYVARTGTFIFYTFLSYT